MKMNAKTAKQQDEQQLVVALDIGTSKVIALVAEVGSAGQLTVVGYGTQPSKGLKRGVVVDIELTTQAIEAAIQEAGLMAECEIHSVITGIAGSHINSLNSYGIVAIRDGEVTQADVDRVIDAAKAVAIPADQQILHVLPQAFTIDKQDGIREPIGMSGVRMEAKVHMVTGAVSAAQNIVKCVNHCDLTVDDIILEQLASSHAVLSDDEKQLGVCLVDIGGGTTDIAVFTHGAIRHTAVIPIAGDQVTNDIAVALRTPAHAAEGIKLQHAKAIIELADPNTLVDVNDISGSPLRQISEKALAEVVEARYEELLCLVNEELRHSGYHNLVVAGVVFTGGASTVPGLTELAEHIMQIPARLGSPCDIVGIEDVVQTPAFSTAVGLLQHGVHYTKPAKSGVAPSSFAADLPSMFTKMKSWITDNF